MKSPFPGSQCWYVKGLYSCQFAMSTVSQASTEKANKWANLLFVKVLLCDLNICLLCVCEVVSLSTDSCECNSPLLFYYWNGTITAKQSKFICIFKKKFHYLLTTF